MDNERMLFDDVADLLKIHGLTYKWLTERLNEAGCTVDKVSMSKWVHGVQVTDKARTAHDLSLKILKEYSKKFADKVSQIK